MITNEIKTSKEARELILNGVEKVAEAVTSTLGPGGQNVMIEQSNGIPPVVTKDGVSVAKSIKLDNNFENLGAQMVIEVASKTNSTCGDGTTTATLLAYEMYKRAAEAVSNTDYKPMEVKRSMLSALEFAKSEVNKCIIPIENDVDICNVAKISANGDNEIGEMVSEIIKETGKDGIVVVQEGSNLTTTHSITKGMRLESGFLSAYFATPNDSGKVITEFENAYILFYMDKLTNQYELFPIMKEVIAVKKAPLIIVAEDFDAEVISGLVINRLQMGTKVCAVKAPGVLREIKKEKLYDAAIATGGTLICTEFGLKLQDVKIEHLGFVKKAEITATTTTFIDGNADATKFETRIRELETQMVDDSLNEYQRHNCRERLARLKGGIGVVKVGGETSSIIHEKRDRIDDAICATREAISGGIVAGAGLTLMKVGVIMSQSNTDNDIGKEIVSKALMTPFFKILSNAGYSDKKEVKKLVAKYTKAIKNGEDIYKCHNGYDVSTWKYCEDLVRSGVIDPANVTLSAITNAISVAALLIATNCMIGINKDSIPQQMMPYDPSGAMM